jgi:pimeloyl-ACP methyl ester carboxylesterase
MDVRSADGTGVVVTDEGHGRPVLIVHPGGAGASSWTLVARRLAKRFRVLRFDRRPYRVPGQVEPSATMANDVADVVAVAEAVGAPVLLVGHSSGAVVALEAARSAPWLFAGMVLYEPPVAVTGPLGGDALVRARAALDAGDPAEAMRIHLIEIVEVPRRNVALMSLLPPVRRQSTKFAANQIRDDSNLESLGVGIDRYAQLDVPALLLGGARSPEHLTARLVALGRVLPRVHSTVVLKRQGHLANAFAPFKVAGVIAGFADAVMP